MSIANLLTDGNKEFTDLKVRTIVLTEGTFQAPLDFYGDVNQLLTFDQISSVFIAPPSILIRLGRIGQIVTITIPELSGMSNGAPIVSFISAPILDEFKPRIDVLFSVIGIANGNDDEILPYAIRIKTDGVVRVTFHLGTGLFGANQIVGTRAWTASYLV